MTSHTYSNDYYIFYRLKAVISRCQIFELLSGQNQGVKQLKKGQKCPRKSNHHLTWHQDTIICPLFENNDPIVLFYHVFSL